MAYLQQTGRQAIGTTRRQETVDEDHLYLNLSEDMQTWQCPRPVDVAFLCAGVTKIEDCKHDPLISARVNIEGISTLVKNLVEKDIFVIYLSTDKVFDGSVAYRLAGDPLSPITEYGRQKAEAERRIGQWRNSVAIVRLTKVLGPVNPLFSTWTKSLRNGKPIYPFSDMVIAPVPLSFVVVALSLIGDRRLSGISQISGNRDISYADVARLGSQWLNVDESLVHPILSSQSSCYSECVASHTTLDISRLKLALNIEPPDVNWTLKMAFTNPQALTASFMLERIEES